MDKYIEGTVYLLRKTGMTLAEIRLLEFSQYRELITEVAYQEECVDHQTVTYIANIMASIANTVSRKTPRTYKADDFLTGRAPRRPGEGGKIEDDKAKLTELCRRFNVKMPVREIKIL